MNSYGLATCFYPVSNVKSWREAKEAGFTDVEIDTNKLLSKSQILEESQKLFDVINEAGLRVSSFHLPHGTPWDISSKDPEHRRKVLDSYLEMIKWCSERKINIVILHSSYEPINPDERSERLNNAISSVSWLSKESMQYGVRIAVEDLPRSCIGNCSAELEKIIDDHENVGICFDVNHLLTDETHRQFMERVGTRVITTHLSDYDRVDERHWVPGEGNIDWKELRTLFEKVNYSGRYLFELKNVSTKTNKEISPKELMDRFKKVYFE